MPSTPPEPGDPLGSGPLGEASDDPYAPDRVHEDAGPIADDPITGGGKTGRGGLY